jgi:RNA polymerase sigma factor (TIGR02999 family)
MNVKVTHLLEVAQFKECSAVEALLPLVYDELRMIAAAKMANEYPGNTLNATALVHEAYFRLVGDQKFEGRAHFFAAAAEAMRRILVERARTRRSLKRGGGLIRLDIEANEPIAPERGEELLALDEALDRLSTVDPQAAQLVQLRYFAGCTLDESAELMAISRRSANRRWAYAKAWLLREIRTE